MLFLFASTTLLTVVAASAFVLKRRLPRLTNANLDLLGVPSNVWVAPAGLTQEEREAMKEAFLKGSDFKWIAAGDKYMKENFEDPSSEISIKHSKITTFMVECMIQFAQNYGHVLVVSENSRGSSEPGEFLGCICLIPPYSQSWLKTAHFFASVLPVGMPVTMGMGGGAQERFNAYTQGLEKAHEEVMHGVKHWYVALLGVSKAAQGKGAGKKLLNAASALLSVTESIYLDCHDQNVPFYEKQGYRHALRHELKVVNDQSNSSTMPYSYNSMVFNGNGK